MADTSDTSLPLILPVGTQVVTLAATQGIDGRRISCGMMGVISASPVDLAHSYEVRFADGIVASLRRQDLAVLAHFQRPPADTSGTADRQNDLYNFVILRVVIGSRAYGLETDASDTDRRGIYLPPAERHWSLFGVPEQLENDATQEVYWELQKFLVMALKANPNVLEVLNSPLIEHLTPLGEELIDLRGAFLSKLVYQTYSGYVMSQFRKLQSDLRNKGEPKWKHVMHLLRLLSAGVTVLREGRVPVHVGDDRDRLLAVRRGELPWEEVEAWRLSLHREFDDAYEKTSLPERPDYPRVNAYLLRARRAAL